MTTLPHDIKSLVRKYDRSGPRYTSYPPAPVFTESFGPRDYEREIIFRETVPSESGVSLYVHIPFCDTLCYFCGCTTFITRNRGQLVEYAQALHREIAMLSPYIHPSRRVDQMHWGGGTPTYFTPSQIVELGTTIRNSFMLADDMEFSVEIDPRDLSYEHLRALRNIGCNRISLGVQDFDPAVQHAVNRNQSEFVTKQAIDWARSLGFASINLDLIYGLPRQTASSFMRTLDRVISISPERIAIYNFAFVPWMKKHQRLIHVEDLPSADEKLDILLSSMERLSDEGYVHIGMDHFAKPDDELAVAQQNRSLQRNFQGYSTRGGVDLYGIGLSSIGHVGTVFAQNVKTLDEYYAALAKPSFATRAGYRMTADDRIREHVIMRLMCDMVLDKRAVGAKFNIDFDNYFESSIGQLKPLIGDGLLTDERERITVTETGRLFLRNIAMCFDAHLVESSQPVFSRTV